LIVEKERGLVKRVMDGKILEPLLQLKVIRKDERRLLGLDIEKKKYTTNNNNNNNNNNVLVICDKLKSLDNALLDTGIDKK